MLPSSRSPKWPLAVPSERPPKSLSLNFYDAYPEHTTLTWAGDPPPQAITHGNDLSLWLQSSAPPSYQEKLRNVAHIELADKHTNPADRLRIGVAICWASVGVIVVQIPSLYQ